MLWVLERKFEQGDATVSRLTAKETDVARGVVWAEEHSYAKSRTKMAERKGLR